MNLARKLAHRWRSITGVNAARQRAAQDGFDAVCADLRSGDLAIDLGANAGIFTAKLAATGADVIAFEPDPYAFDLLSTKLGDAKNVTLVQAAASVQAGQMTLHRTANFENDPARHTTSSSLLSDKRNVAGGQGVEVDVIDIIAYLTELDRDVKLIKIDIEGAEVEVMERLLSSPLALRIGYIFVETHERAIPRLADRTDTLRARTADQTRPLVNWDWH